MASTTLQTKASEQTKVSDVMTKNPQTLTSDSTVADAAKLMWNGNFGCVPIEENDRLIGVITDRDITTQVTAQDKDPNTVTVKEVMSQKVLYCNENDTLEEILLNLGEQQIHRLPVMNDSKRLVGEIALADIATSASIDSGLYQLIGKTIAQISQTTGTTSH